MQAETCERPDDGREWVPSGEAARMLGIGRDPMVSLAKRHGLTVFHPKQRNAALCFLRTEVEALVKARAERAAWIKEHHRYRGRRRRADITPDAAEEPLIQTAEAAKILGVTPDVVRDMVERGRLLCYQKRPGTGSRLWFSEAEVRTYAMSRQRAVWQAAYQKGQKTLWYRLYERAEEMRRNPGGSDDLWKYGEWMTARQAALLLGVNRRRVRQLWRVGRLPQSPAPYAKWQKRKKPRWFRKKDVLALMANPTYARWHARYVTAHTLEKREARESKRILELVAWTRRVNGWDDPRHSPTYQMCPGRSW